MHEIGIECMRERATGQQPPDKRIHVWWARRPLTVSRAAVLGSLLPADYDRKDFLEHLGIPKGADPIGAKKKLDEVRSGLRKDRIANPYGYPRAFTHNLSVREEDRLRAAFEKQWGDNKIAILDSFAGGGSIPLESFRMGVDVFSSELNPVASVLQRAIIDYPSRYPDLAKEIEVWGERIAAEVEGALSECFPRKPGEKGLCYIWVRTVRCPSCELKVPLSPNWRLDKANKLGFKPVVPKRGAGDQCEFEVRHDSNEFSPEIGTVKRGAATCPRCSTSMPVEDVKKEAVAGRMTYQLAVVGFNLDNKPGRFFRPPTKQDLAGVDLAANLLKERAARWQQLGIYPSDPLPEGTESWTHGNTPAQYGAQTFADLFTSRQLLVHLTTLEVLLRQPWGEIKDAGRREAIRVYMALALDKCLDYNSVASRLDTTRVVVKNTFDRHDFALVWSFGEIEGAGALFRFGVSQQVDAVTSLSKLTARLQKPKATFIVANASATGLPSKSLTSVVIDPPYYDNVMYAELSDYFYVWMKHSLGDVFPDLFSRPLTEKDAEAVANTARFRAVGRKGAKKLADEDYTAKMLAALRECNRLLRDDGVLTIMFTHKRLDAWDSLGRALVDAGFEITATWPVHTESEHSLHQAKKNAAASTILLVCRKRIDTTTAVWWDEIQGELRSHVRDRAEKFAAMGLRGQDTSIASFGPALQVISRQWPVKRKDGTVIRPEEALDLAREEVMTWLFERIAEGQVKAVDKWTRFYILAWFVFGAREFPYDEARKLALALKVDIDKELMPHKVLEKKSNNVRLLTPKERAQKGHLEPTKKSYDWDIDYVHAAVHAYENGMGGELSKFHQRTGALARDGYKNAISYLLDVLPRVKEVSEYHTLDKMWEGNLQDQVKRRKPRTDPTFEKQQRLAIDGEAEEGGEAEGDVAEEADEE